MAQQAARSTGGPGVRALPAGRHALLLELGDPGEALAVYDRLQQLRRAGAVSLGEVVPAAETVLVSTPGDVEALSGVLRALGAGPGRPAGTAPAARPSDTRSSLPGPARGAGVSGPAPVEVPTSYDGEDLEQVARAWGMTRAEAVATHTGLRHVAAFSGFLPGFAYLRGLPAELAVPRRATPRPRVPPGSVAVAGTYSGIYPKASPGGWQVLGHTDLELFDPARDPPALIVPGATVRFSDLTAPRRRRAGKAAGGPPSRRSPTRPVTAATPGLGAAAIGEVPGTGARPALRVTRAGWLTTVQDGGRPGLAHLGVPPSGALDRRAFRLANRIVGNDAAGSDEAHAALETTMTGVGLEATARCVVAVTGAAAPVRVDGRPAALGEAIELGAGCRLEVGTAREGFRCYVAVRGGIDVEPVLGSRSTDLLSGLGPRPLVVGDLLPIGPAPPGRPVPGAVPIATPPPFAELRLDLGPRDDWLTEAGRSTLARGCWRVGAASNRSALRLEGPVVGRRAGDLDSEGLVAGAVQVPPDGQPIVFLADRPTTGGYPVVGVVDDEGLALAAQARPGSEVRFRVVERTAAPVLC